MPDWRDSPGTKVKYYPTKCRDHTLKSVFFQRVECGATVLPCQASEEGVCGVGFQACHCEGRVFVSLDICGTTLHHFEVVHVQTCCYLRSSWQLVKSREVDDV